MRLHDNPSSGNGYKVRLLLTQLGIPFERIEYDIDEGETRTPEFLKNVNPNGRIPVLETESGEYLPRVQRDPVLPRGRHPYLSDDRFERARVLQWMFFDTNPPISQNTRATVPCRADRGGCTAGGVG